MTLNLDPFICLMALDVGCAFMYESVDRELYIDLPSADPLYMNAQHVGRLRRALYGAREAPTVWQRERATTLKSLGFCASRLHPGACWHASRHQDDPYTLEDCVVLCMVQETHQWCGNVNAQQR